MLPPLLYTLSYEAMLACEKKGTSSRILSICRSDCSIGRRIGLLSTVGVVVAPGSGGAALYEQVNEWPVLVGAGKGTHFCDGQVAGDLSQSVQHRFREPIFRAVDCVDRVCDEDPLVATDPRVIRRACGPGKDKYTHI